MVERLKQLCEKKGTTFSALEKELGFANGSLRKTDGKIQSVRLKLLADYFGVSMEYILTGASSIADSLSDDECDILTLFRSLSSTGQSAALMMLTGLLSDPAFVKEKNQNLQIS